MFKHAPGMPPFMPLTTPGPSAPRCSTMRKEAGGDTCRPSMHVPRHPVHVPLTGTPTFKLCRSSAGVGQSLESKSAF